MKLRWLFALLLVAQSASAAEEGTINSWINRDPDNRIAPVENEFTLPELAKLKEWHIYPNNKWMGKTKVEIAADSISVGKEDAILRYAIAITPPGGARNVLFEGLDCDSQRYRTYAFATASKTWKKTSRVKWKVAYDNTNNVWQYQIYSDYCGIAGPNSAENIAASVRKGVATSKPN